MREVYIDTIDSTPFIIKYGKYFLLFGTATLWYEYLNEVKKINGILTMEEAVRYQRSDEE